MAKQRRTVSWAALLMVVSLDHLQPLEAQPPAPEEFVPVTDAMLRDPDPGDWLIHLPPKG